MKLFVPIGVLILIVIFSTPVLGVECNVDSVKEYAIQQGMPQNATLSDNETLSQCGKEIFSTYWRYRYPNTTQYGFRYDVVCETGDIFDHWPTFKEAFPEITLKISCNLYEQMINASDTDEIPILLFLGDFPDVSELIKERGILTSAWTQLDNIRDNYFSESVVSDDPQIEQVIDEFNQAYGEYDIIISNDRNVIAQEKSEVVQRYDEVQHDITYSEATLSISKDEARQQLNDAGMEKIKESEMINKIIMFSGEATKSSIGNISELNWVGEISHNAPLTLEQRVENIPKILNKNIVLIVAGALVFIFILIILFRYRKSISNLNKPTNKENNYYHCYH